MEARMEILPSGLKEVMKDEETKLEVRIYYLECLAQATYVISHDGVAFIVDPRRDIEAYLIDFQALGVSLKGILETHFHADFVSGHNELMKRTNATIYFGPSAGQRCKFPHHEVVDEEVIPLSSRYSFKVLHTPGHTLESVVYLLVDTMKNKPIKAFTGDTLFIGSCGRPDLVGSIGFTSEQMASMMFKTLNDKICTLPPDVQVFPAHGAGSPCGKNLSTDHYSTIGKEKQTNPALQFTDVEEFVKFLTNDQPSSPGYFPHDVEQNISGAEPLAEQLKRIPRLSHDKFRALVEDGTHTIIDTRKPSDYGAGFIEGSLNFPLGKSGGAIVSVEDGNFAMWIGTLVSCKANVLLIVNPEKENEALQRLARIGYTNVTGVLEGGMKNWIQSSYPILTTHRLNIRGSPGTLLSDGYSFIDVRTRGEYEINTVKDAINVPLNEIYNHLNKLDKSKKYIAFCSSGYRSVLATSIFTSEGFNVLDIYGGFAAISVYMPHLTTSGQICPVMKAMIEKLEATMDSLSLLKSDVCLYS